MRVLIVDDHDGLRRSLRSLLSSHSDWAICGEAADGVEAVEKARKLCPDLIIMDISMPRMDGIEATRIIQHDVPQAQVVIVSQNHPTIVRRQAAEVGARAYVTKANLSRDLIPTLEQLNGGRSGTKETIFSHGNDYDLPKESWLSENFRQIIDALPAVIYTTDAQGHVTHFNPAAVEFSGRVPELGTDKWCVSWKILLPDGTPVPHDQCPMAIAIKEGRIVDGGEFIAERPDGKRTWFSPYPRLLRDAEGTIIGGVNMLVDITERKRAEQASRLLAAIVDSSDDAIVSKNLDGIITSWNHAAERTFGYTAQEAIGQSITLVVPPERLDEERTIIKQLKRGERVDHFETVRMRKDHSTLDISLTISPVKDASGRVIGASKVARDVSERKRAEKALAKGARQQKALFLLADQLHRALSVEDVYNVAMDAIFTASQCDRASISLYDDNNIMRFVRWRGGLSDGYRKATEGHSPWTSDVKDPQPVCMNDLAKADLGESLKAALKAEGISALAFIPLVSNGKLMGKFMMYFNEPHVFNDDELDLSLTIARQLAFGIDRRRAEEDLRQSEERFRKLAETLDAEVRVRTRELELRNADVLRQSERLRDLSQRLMRSQDDERRHIARELHDSAGQTLAVLGMTLARVAQEIDGNSPRLLKEAEQGQQLVQQLNQEIRTMSYLLHPPLLDESGLLAALNWYVRGLTERSGLNIELCIPEDFGRLPREMELVVFRVVQECLTNIHRHSGSESAVIRLARDAENILLEVQDQGKGMSLERLAEIQSQSSGVGIRGMRERIRQFEGDLTIESNESGTRISVTLPVPESYASSEQSTLEEASHARIAS